MNKKYVIIHIIFIDFSFVREQSPLPLFWIFLLIFIYLTEKFFYSRFSIVISLKKSI